MEHPSIGISENLLCAFHHPSPGALKYTTAQHLRNCNLSKEQDLPDCAKRETLWREVTSEST